MPEEGLPPIPDAARMTADEVAERLHLDPIGMLAQRRITDVATQTRFGPALQRLADTYTDGDTEPLPLPPGPPQIRLDTDGTPYLTGV